MQVINGTTYYRFPRAVFLALVGGVVGPMANAAVAMYADEAGTAIGLLTLGGQPWTPTTDANGLTAEFLAPQYDDIICDGGLARQNIRCADMAEVIAGIAATSAQSVLDIVQPQIDQLRADLAAGSRATYA